MRIVSLFAGIGGLELGLEAAIPGAHVVAQVEIDPHCRHVLAKHWPQALRYSDVRTVHRPVILPCGAQHIAAPLPAYDLVCGGFPCQDLSLAGRGAGLGGARSGLWWEFHRIIRETRPRFVVLENVAALVVRGLDVVLGALAQLGYDAEWSVLSAASVGAPHLRRRVFVIAWLPDTERRELRQQQGGQCGTPKDRRKRKQVPAEPGQHGAAGDVADASGEHSRQQPQLERRGRNPTEPARDGAVGAVADTDGLRCQVSEDARARTAQPDGGSQAAHLGRCPQSRMGGASHGLSAWTYRGTDPEAWEQGVARTVAPRTVPDRVARLKCLGNAVVPQCGYEVGLRVLRLLSGNVA